MARSLQEIARMAGVSKMTVSRALRGAPGVSLTKRDEIVRLAAQQGYQRNAKVDILMTQLRQGRNSTFKATLGYLDVRSSDIVRKYAADNTMLEGVRARAAEVGYSLDVFYLSDFGFSEKRLLQVLETRGIKGLAIVETDPQERNFQTLRKVIERHPCVCLGHAPKTVTLPFCINDIYSSMRLAVHNLLGLGYKRIALSANDSFDKRGGRSASAGYLGAMLNASLKPLSIFYTDGHTPPPKAFEKWLRSQRPEVILTDRASIIEDLQAIDLKVPEDIGLVHLNLVERITSWAGIRQQNARLGACAVDCLVSQIQLFQKGFPEYPTGILLEGKWSDGETLRSKAKT